MMPQLAAGRRQLPTARGNISYHEGGFLTRLCVSGYRYCHHLQFLTPLLCPFLWISIFRDRKTTCL